jgi:hypothetical protein
MRDNNEVVFFSSADFYPQRFRESVPRLAGRLTPHDSAIELSEDSSIDAFVL